MGFALVDGHRFDIRPGSTVGIPYRARHQIVNTGDKPLLYVSALAFPLEHFVKLARLEQLDRCARRIPRSTRRGLLPDDRAERFSVAEHVAITHVFEEPPHHHGGRHKHLEAVLYVLDGEGHSDMHGEPKPWSTGDVLHIPPAMYEHEHFNECDRISRMLRIQFGIRYWFTDIWPQGYRPQRIYTESGEPMISGPIDTRRPGGRSA